jgi:hypothetical protein
VLSCGETTRLVIRTRGLRFAYSHKPMGVGVDQDLDSEDDGEEGVELLEPIPERGREAGVVGQVVYDLRLRGVHQEILQPGARRVGTLQ